MKFDHFGDRFRPTVSEGLPKIPWMRRFSPVSTKSPGPRDSLDARDCNDPESLSIVRSTEHISYEPLTRKVKVLTFGPDVKLIVRARSVRHIVGVV